MTIQAIVNSKKIADVKPAKEVIGKNKFNGNYDSSKFKRTAREIEEQ